MKFQGNIAFKKEMMIANLQGWKCQTRRLPRFQPARGKVAVADCQPGGGVLVDQADPRVSAAQSARYKVGDRLWVREAFRFHKVNDSASPRLVYLESLPSRNRAGIRYEADLQIIAAHKRAFVAGRYWPAMFMPFFFSRAYVEITGVRFERLQDMPPDDVYREGFRRISKDGVCCKTGIADSDGLPGNDVCGWPWVEWCIDPLAAYRQLWDSINRRGGSKAVSGAPVDWAGNPWVIVYDYEFHLMRGKS
jgi:hypothetical protein